MISECGRANIALTRALTDVIRATSWTQNGRRCSPFDTAGCLRQTSMREAIKAIFYLLCTGRPGATPRDGTFPPRFSSKRGKGRFFFIRLKIQEFR